MHDEQSQRPTDDNRDAWIAYWQALGMPWRTEPEIDEARQQFLAERRAVTPDIERGVYPFRDEHGSIKLTRTDVEWLLASHESGGKRGPIDRTDVTLWQREGLDLRGADASGTNLSRLPLSRLCGGLAEQDWQRATEDQRARAALNLEGTCLTDADLERSILRGANLQRADLRGAILARSACISANFTGALLRWTQFQGAHLGRVQLAGTDLRLAFFNSASNFRPGDWDSVRAPGPILANVHWDGADLSFVQWLNMTMLGDEVEAWQVKDSNDKRKGAVQRLTEFKSAVRANRQLATVLRNQGLNEDADRFAYRAQVLQRTVLRRQRNWLRWFGSLVLDVIAGYGYRPLRAFAAYAVVILGFMGLYLFNSHFVAPHLSWNEALVLSMSSFHGRGFFNSAISLGDTYAELAAGEAFVGLFIEITFIATFTQRFFAR